MADALELKIDLALGYHGLRSSGSGLVRAAAPFARVAWDTHGTSAETVVLLRPAPRNCT